MSAFVAGCVRRVGRGASTLHARYLVFEEISQNEHVLPSAKNHFLWKRGGGTQNQFLVADSALGEERSWLRLFGAPLSKLLLAGATR